MRIKDVELYGTGRHNGAVVKGLQGGFTLVYGRNEAGKSTLLAGIRGVLFGKLIAGEPKINLARGAEGRVLLEREDGATFWIERGLAKKSVPRINSTDGTILMGQDSLKTIFPEFRAVEDSVYQSVFTFQLSELNDLTSADATLQSRLYTIGLLGKRSPIEVEQAFLMQGREIFNPDRRAKSPRLNQRLKEIDMLSEQIQLKRNTADDYAEVVRQLEKAKQSHESVKALVVSAGQELAMTQKDVEALRLHRKGMTIADRLASLPPTRLADADIKRCAEFNQQLSVCEERLQHLEVNREHWLGKRNALQFQREWIDALPELHRLQAASSGVLEQEKAWCVRQDELNALLPRIETVKSQLNTAWRDEDILRLVLPATLVDFAEQTVATEEGVRRELEHIQRTLVAKEQMLAERRQSLLARGIPEDKSESRAQGEVREVQERLELVRENMDSFTDLERKVSAFLVKQQDWTVARRLASPAASNTLHVNSVSLLIWAMSLISFAFAIWSWRETQRVDTAFLAGFGLVGVWMGQYVRHLQKVQSRHHNQSETNLRIELLQEELERMQSEIEHLLGRFGAAGMDWTRPQTMEHIRASLRKDLSARERLKEDALTTLQLVQARVAAQTEIQRLTMDGAYHERKLTSLREEWKCVAGRVDLRLNELQPATFLREARLLQQLRESMLQLRSLQSMCEDLAASITSFQRDLHVVLVQVHATFPNESEIAAGRESGTVWTNHAVERWVHALHDAIDEAKKHRAFELEWLECQREWERCTQSIEEEAKKQQSLLMEKHQLYTELQIEDDDQYLQRVQSEDERRVLEVELREVRSELHGLYGGAESYQARIATLSQATEATLEEAQLAAQSVYQTCKSRADDALKQVAHLEQQVEGWEKGPQAMELNWKLSAVQSEKIQLAREWAVYASAAHMIRAARESFEQSHRPKTLIHAGSILERVTEGRYVHLHARADEKGHTEVLCGDKHGKAWHLSELSRGTREQIYLAVRLAVVHEYAERGVHMPLVLDDVMVNFDADRQAVFLEVLQETAVYHQVIYLTCQQGLANLATGLGGIQCVPIS